jgi:hypothetical protein
MKKICFSVFLILLSVHLNAQILNSGFENWTNMGSYEVPDHWGTLNHATSHLNVYTVTKWNPGSPGAHFMKITSKMYGMNVMNGIAVYGKLDSTSLQPLSGYPFTQRPAVFSGQWQHMIWGTSQGSVCATLTKWNAATVNRDTIAIAYEELFDMAMNWEAFSINFIYSSGDIPDSCMIVLKSSGDNPELNDYLWVDDLAFSGAVDIRNPETKNDIRIYPNPSSDEVRIAFLSDQPQTVSLELSDVTGRIIIYESPQAYNAENEARLNISTLPNGTYFLKLSGQKSFCFKKIIVSHPNN